MHFNFFKMFFKEKRVGLIPKKMFFKFYCNVKELCYYFYSINVNRHPFLSFLKKKIYVDIFFRIIILYWEPLVVCTIRIDMFANHRSITFTVCRLFDQRSLEIYTYHTCIENIACAKERKRYIDREKWRL